MDRSRVSRLLLAGCSLIILGACAAAPPKPEAVAPTAPVPAPGRLPAEAPKPPETPKPIKLPDLFESEEFIVAFPNTGGTAESLAAKFLGDPAKGWMIEEYNGLGSFLPGQEVVIPKRPRNFAGVDPSGYQLVPILVYHNIGPQAKGRLLIAAKTFEEQMRYLKAQGYRVVSLKEFFEFISLGRQLPRKSVILTFDDGYKSFLQYAYPLLKELGFTATLFIYTDYVGAGKNALDWEDLKRLAEEGFQIAGHSKTHGNLRQPPGEPDAEYASRMQAELGLPQKLFQQRLGEPAQFLAYPYGGTDDTLIQRVKENGFVAAFTVRREGNPSFVHSFKIHRSQIYSEMSLEDFAKNLNTFNQEAIK